jgi:hypothetical protein
VTDTAEPTPPTDPGPPYGDEEANRSDPGVAEDDD